MLPSRAFVRVSAVLTASLASMAGATTTIGSADAATVVREEPVVPKKVEAAPAQVPVEVVEAKLPAPIELPREEPRAVAPPPVPPPKPRILPATLSELNPPAGAKL